MRGTVHTTLAAIRAYRQSDKHRRQAADATWTRLAERERVGMGAQAGPEGKPTGSPVRRSLIAFGVPTGLLAAALVAIFFGTVELSQSGHSPWPRGGVDPNTAAPTVSVYAVPAAGGTHGPARITPLPNASTPESPAQGAGISAATGPTPGTGTPMMSTPAATGSTASTGAPGTVSPQLLELCRAVVAVGKSWPSVIKRADRLMLIAAAGSRKNVLPYCTALVNNTLTG